VLPFVHNDPNDHIELRGIVPGDFNSFLSPILHIWCMNPLVISFFILKNFVKKIKVNVAKIPQIKNIFLNPLIIMSIPL
jgi:hypothetical protein